MVRVINMTNEVFKNLLPTLLGTYIIAMGTWTYTSNDRMTTLEINQAAIQKNVGEASKTLAGIQIQLNQYNNELLKLVSKQDQRLVKVETILSIMVEDRKESKK